jgi:hypothetical protein
MKTENETKFANNSGYRSSVAVRTWKNLQDFRILTHECILCIARIV